MDNFFLKKYFSIVISKMNVKIIWLDIIKAIMSTFRGCLDNVKFPYKQNFI